MWTERSFVDDVLIHFKRGYIVAEYPPLGIKAEGGNEREARDALMTGIWASVAHRYEDWLKELFKPPLGTPIPIPTIKDMMNSIVFDYYEKNPRQPVAREVNMELIPIVVETPDDAEIIEDPDGKLSVRQKTDE